MNKEILLNKIDKLKEPKILVVGDFALDEMIFGDTQRISREAPVLILLHNETKIILGTASNAANNVSSLNGGKVAALGVYGSDYYGPVLLKTLSDAGIDTQYMVLDKTRKTTTKTRISGACSNSVTQQIVRIDRQSSEPISKEIEDRVIENLEIAIPKFDGVILSDYHLGLLTDRVVNAVVEIAKRYNKIVVADVQKDFEKYKGVYSMTPNQPDSEKFLGYFINEDNLEKSGFEILNKANLNSLLLTRGADGMAIFEKENNSLKFTKIPAFNKKEVFDVTGAGDTVVATYALGLCAGLSAEDAAIIGNLAASIVIRQFGCHTTSIDELKEELNKLKEDK
ncbi:MAG: D-glycero-beta-D-manno-heptose-7-phosphate kinase [Cyanobacteria bacterium SIG30]|nr:D-glycero-beta-D-manno-heptose-7-phosphate kinase [Cyanobacteria bacterium SIG30]